MSMYIPEPGAGDFAPAPEGAHPAVCVRVIDLGTQPGSDLYPEPRHQVLLGWELVHEFMSDGRPFLISQRYTFSMHKRSKLKPLLEQWRGKAFEKADFSGPNRFHMSKLLGQPCLVTVVHSERGDRVYANVAAVTGMPRGMARPEARGQQLFVSLDPAEFNEDAFNALAGRLQDTIRQSPEWAALDQGSGSAPAFRAPAAPARPAPSLPAPDLGVPSRVALPPRQEHHSVDLDDEIPF